MAAHEHTLAIIKPDAFRKKAVGKIIEIIENNNFSIIAARMMHLSQPKAEAFYEIHKDKYFFKDLVSFMCSGPIMALVLSAPDAIHHWREIMGSTDIATAKPGTIRQLFGTSVRENSIHGSDSHEHAVHEIAFFFSKRELVA